MMELRIVMKNSWIVLLMAMALVGCGRKEDARGGRTTTYDSAMSDYRAGRLEVAIEGFRKAIKTDPMDASARFQFACLLQDGKKDYIGAYCAYNEYINLAASSDKAKVAKERMAVCEREMASVLAEKYSLSDMAERLKEIEELKGQLKLAIDRNRKLEEDLSESIRRSLMLKNENEKLLTSIRDVDLKDAAKHTNRGIKDAKALLEEEDESGDRIASSADIAALRIEGETESGSELLKEVNDVAETTESIKKEVTPVEAKPAEPAHEERPAEYVVQEGETLSKIAMRFYGSRSAWKKIRDANKATISVDGRVIAGQRIKLP